MCDAQYYTVICYIFSLEEYIYIIARLIQLKGFDLLYANGYESQFIASAQFHILRPLKYKQSKYFSFGTIWIMMSLVKTTRQNGMEIMKKLTLDPDNLLY